jgi:tyrosinase
LVSSTDVWNKGRVDDKQVDQLMTEDSAVIAGSYGKAAELVYRLLTYPTDYVHFATLARNKSAESAGSKVTNDINIEFIDNNIHSWIGGKGSHMSQMPVAAFDPIFWLHHW